MKKLMLTISLFASSSAIAVDDSKFKMAVIKDSTGASAIKTGDFERGLQRINNQQLPQDDSEQIARQMNLCVAYASLYQLSQAQKACDQAIQLTQKTQFNGNIERNIASLALNNRAIMKAKAHDYNGALQDLLAAIKVKKSRVITDNLIQLIQLQSEQVEIKPQQLTKV